MAEVEIVQADLSDLDQQQAVLSLLNSYAQDPIISGQPLTKEVQAALIEGLSQHPTTLVLMAYGDDTPVGLAVCFVGFSTFAAKPILNIHDLAVSANWRGQGVGAKLLAAVEAQARRLGCCKVTLEVHDDNVPARAIYQAAGFGPSPSERQCLFLYKKLPS